MLFKDSYKHTLTCEVLIHPWKDFLLISNRQNQIVTLNVEI